MPELTENKKIKALITINDTPFIESEESKIYEYIGTDEAFIYIKGNSDQKIKIHFSKNELG